MEIKQEKEGENDWQETKLLIGYLVVDKHAYSRRAMRSMSRLVDDEWSTGRNDDGGVTTHWKWRPRDI